MGTLSTPGGEQIREEDSREQGPSAQAAPSIIAHHWQYTNPSLSLLSFINRHQATDQDPNRSHLSAKQIFRTLPLHIYTDVPTLRSGKGTYKPTDT